MHRQHLSFSPFFLSRLDGGGSAPRAKACKGRGGISRPSLAVTGSASSPLRRPAEAVAAKTRRRIEREKNRRTSTDKKREGERGNNLFSCHLHCASFLLPFPYPLSVPKEGRGAPSPFLFPGRPPPPPPLPSDPRGAKSGGSKGEWEGEKPRAYLPPREERAPEKPAIRRGGGRTSSPSSQASPPLPSPSDAKSVRRASSSSPERSPRGGAAKKEGEKRSRGAGCIAGKKNFPLLILLSQGSYNPSPPLPLFSPAAPEMESPLLLLPSAHLSLAHHTHVHRPPALPLFFMNLLSLPSWCHKAASFLPNSGGRNKQGALPPHPKGMRDDSRGGITFARVLLRRQRRFFVLFSRGQRRRWRGKDTPDQQVSVKEKEEEMLISGMEKGGRDRYKSRNEEGRSGERMDGWWWRRRGWVGGWIVYMHCNWRPRLLLPPPPPSFSPVAGWKEDRGRGGIERGRREDALLRVRGRERPSSSSSFPPPPSFILFSSSHSQCCRSPPPTSSEDPISHLDLLLVPPLPPATTTCLHTDGGRQEGEGRRRYGVKRLRSPTSLGCSTVQ